MDRATYPNPKVVNLAQKMITVKQNTDKSPDGEVAKKFGVEGLPTILFLDSKGNKLHEVSGFLEADAFAKEMQTALSKAKK